MREAEESLSPSNYRAVVSKGKGKSGSLCLHMGAGKSTLIFVSSPAAMREFKKGNQTDILGPCWSPGRKQRSGAEWTPMCTLWEVSKRFVHNQSAVWETFPKAKCGRTRLLSHQWGNTGNESGELHTSLRPCVKNQNEVFTKHGALSKNFVNHGLCCFSK